MEYKYNTCLKISEKVYHGGMIHTGHPLIMDFSVSLNPYPPPEAVLDAISSSDPINYPDAAAHRLVQSLSKNYEMPEDELLIVNGISQGIFLLSMLFIEQGDPILIIGPTYGEYEKNSRLFGAEIYYLNFSPPKDFKSNTTRIMDEITKLKPKLIWLCNPNNPSGSLISHGDIVKIANSCEKEGSILILDDAYINLSDEPEPFWKSHPAVIRIHSLTKDFSLAGLRIGYIHANADIIEKLRAIQPEWSINSPAINAAEAALNNIEIYKKQWRELLKETRDLIRKLNKSGFKTEPTKCNIILIKKRRSSSGKIIPTSVLLDRLLAQGITVRDCTSFGLPDYFRIGTRLPWENRFLIGSLSNKSLWEI